MALGKRMKAARAAIDPVASHGVKDAVKLVKEHAKAKFDESVEIAMNLGVDPRHADQMVRGTVTLPNGTGKSVRVAVFARGPKAEEAQAAESRARGADREPTRRTGLTNDSDRLAVARGDLPAFAIIEGADVSRTDVFSDGHLVAREVLKNHAETA